MTEEPEQPTQQPEILPPQEQTGEPTTLASIVRAVEIAPLACTLSLPVGDGRTAMRRSRVTAIDAHGVSVETTDDDRAAIRELIARRTPILVTLRPLDGERLFFSAPLRVEPLNATVDRTTLALPDKVLLTQRRSYFRVPINPGDDVKVRVWRIADYGPVRDRPLPSQECLAELLDLGAGGLRVGLRARGQNVLNLEENQRFRIELTTSKKEMLLEGRLRYPRATGPMETSAICGIRFVHRDTIESRANIQTLHMLLATLQRTAVRNRAIARDAAAEAARAAAAAAEAAKLTADVTPAAESVKPADDAKAA